MFGAFIALGGACLAIVAMKSHELASILAGDDDITWQTVDISGVITVEIPSMCTIDPGAGNHYVVCATAENPTPTPEMNLSSDGMTMNIKRWENLDSPYWDHVIGSIHVVQPMTHNVTITIQK